MTTHKSLAVLFGAAMLASCSIFDVTVVESRESPLLTARIKFNNFAPSPTGVTTPSVNFFANSTKMTAILSANCETGTGLFPTDSATRAKCLTTGIEATTGTGYAGNAGGGLYVGIAPGNYTFTAKKAATDTVISTVTQAIADGKYYTFYMSGVYNPTTFTADAFVLEDAIPASKDYTKALIRFVNAVPDGTSAISLYITSGAVGSTEQALGGATAYKSATAFIEVPEGQYTAQAKYGSTNITQLTRAAFTVIGGHAYTITARGSTATTTTLGMDLTENQR